MIIGNYNGVNDDDEDDGDDDDEEEDEDGDEDEDDDLFAIWGEIFSFWNQQRALSNLVQSDHDRNHDDDDDHDDHKDDDHGDDDDDDDVNSGFFPILFSPLLFNWLLCQWQCDDKDMMTMISFKKFSHQWSLAEWKSWQILKIELLSKSALHLA